MLSILIPTYYYDATLLVQNLHQQAIEASIDFEIVVAEDGSIFFLEENKKIESLSNVKYEILKKNIGRSAIRNYLADKAKYEYLLFFDCDSEICVPDFLQKYIENCKKNCVVLGGRIYTENFDSQYSLLAKYGKKNERNTSKNIKKHSAHKVFTSPNFLIYKKIFDKVKFDENFKEYGHEDTIFGFDLLKFGYNFDYIDNPVLHKGLDENISFIEKTKLSLNTLLKLYKSNKFPELNKNSKILIFFSKIEKLNLVSIIAFFYKIFEKQIIKQITGKNPSLFLFDLFKLGYLCELEQRIKTG